MPGWKGSQGGPTFLGKARLVLDIPAPCPDESKGAQRS